jgi:CheY-like chemotaxis protein
VWEHWLLANAESRVGPGNNKQKYANKIFVLIDSLLTALAGLCSQRRSGPGGQRAANQHPLTGRLTVVALMSSDDEDSRLLAAVGEQNGWRVVFADTVSGARTVLDQGSLPVILCDRKLLGTEWRTSISVLSGPPRPACVILVSVAVDTYLWNEVVRAGGYDVVSKPLRAEDVTRAIRLARSYCCSPARMGIFTEESRRRGEGRDS